MNGIARGVAGVVTIAVGVGVAVFLHDLADAGEPWASWRDALRSSGYVIVPMTLTWLLLGAVLQTPVAIRRRAGLRAGWIVVGGLFAYHMVVGLFAVKLAAIAPLPSPGVSGSDPGYLYGVFLGCVLVGPALLSAFGGWFLEPLPPSRPGLLDNRPEDVDDRTDPVRLNLFIIMVASWAPGWCFLSYIFFHIADRYELPLLPSDGMPILAVGTAVAVPSLVIVVVIRLFLADMPVKRAFPRLLLLGAVVALLIAAALAQLTRFLPAGYVILVSILLPMAYVYVVHHLYRAAPGE
ncbi:hypothetical protein [Actinoplanes sp. DH11]|uniref:hypothetical protein n=1 Tax=Actinoplanes sp. DH11 TaxID=2857011 RepID=UPI001E2B86AF|nr:hypothetical protein [Actinoplanes sp. DH11]